MKFINIAFIISILILNITGCNKNNKLQDNTQPTISESKVENSKEDIQILDVKIDLKQLDKEDSNIISYLQENVKGGIDAGTKNSFNIDIKQGDILRIYTEIKKPITVILKDNSTGEYVYNKNQIAKDNYILIDGINKSGNYELTVDFNEIETFSFKVYISNSN